MLELSHSYGWFPASASTAVHPIEEFHQICGNYNRKDNMNKGVGRIRQNDIRNGKTTNINYEKYRIQAKKRQGKKNLQERFRKAKIILSVNAKRLKKAYFQQRKIKTV